MAQPPVFYAIGDIHGELARLKELHTKIADFHGAAYSGRAKRIIHIGDYVDRGPDSYGVIEHLIATQVKQPDEMICLFGNHEQLMLDGCSGHAGALQSWIDVAGPEGFDSYTRAGHDRVLLSHLRWLKRLPLIHIEQAAGLIFVHAGIHPAEYPNEKQDIYLWTRSARFFDTGQWTSPALDGMRVIHGHTPTAEFEPEISPDGRRINVDTGAVFGGPLTAAVIAGEDRPIFLRV